jgi:hypothetical protein
MCGIAAASISIFTIAFPDPYSISYENNKFDTLPVCSSPRSFHNSPAKFAFDRLQSNISFQYPITSNIQTLSTKNVEKGSDPYGILFVPDLRSDLCKKNEGQHVPANATRQSNLPGETEYALIAFAPWFSVDCTLEYFEAARKEPAVKAFLVYQPGTNNDMPPIMNDPSWGLGDGGSWKSANNFPTYALASITGSIIVDQLSKYSGNITDAPNGHELASIYNPTDYVRLWSTVNTGWQHCLQVVYMSLTFASFGVTASQPVGVSCHCSRPAHPRHRFDVLLHASHPTETTQRSSTTGHQRRDRPRGDWREAADGPSRVSREITIIHLFGRDERGRLRQDISGSSGSNTRSSIIYY